MSTDITKIKKFFADRFHSNIHGVSTDSRNISPSSLFIAIPGETFDPHKFLDQAITNGAAGLMVQRANISDTEIAKLKERVPVWVVENTLSSFRELAAAYRGLFSFPVIGVIGSVGKTTTKEFIAALLKGRFSQIQKTEASQNGFLGIPLTIFQWNEKTEIGIVEIGIDDLGAMEQHIALARPTLTILTQTGPEHLHQLKDEETAAREEILGLDLTLKQGGQCIANVEDQRIAKWYAGIGASSAGNIVTYTRTVLETSPWASPLPGAHQALNLSGAIAVARSLGLTDDEIGRGLATFKGATGRTELVTLGNKALILADHYNSNPTSLKAALGLLKELSASHDTERGSHVHKGPRIAVLGDMLELGENEELYHRNVAADLATASPTSVFLYGKRMLWLFDVLKTSGANFSVQHFDNHDELCKALIPSVTAECTILIKGSRGMKLENVLKKLTETFAPK